MYTLAVLFVLLYTLTLERLVNGERRLVLAAVMAGIVLALGVYTHYYVMFFALGAISAALFIVRRSWKRVARIVSSSVLGVVLFAPSIPIALQLARSDGQTFRTFFVSVVSYTFFRFVIGYAVFPLNVDTKEYFVSSIFAHIPWLIRRVRHANALSIKHASAGRSEKRHRDDSMLDICSPIDGWVLVISEGPNVERKIFNRNFSGFFNSLLRVS